jgi:hypothetical protein
MVEVPSFKFQTLCPVVYEETRENQNVVCELNFSFFLFIS